MGHRQRFSLSGTLGSHGTVPAALTAGSDQPHRPGRLHEFSDAPIIEVGARHSAGLEGCAHDDVVGQLASQAGLSSDAVSSQLANLLPGLIDKLTPDGKIPSGGVLEQGLNLLKGKLG